MKKISKKYLKIGKSLFLLAIISIFNLDYSAARIEQSISTEIFDKINKLKSHALAIKYYQLFTAANDLENVLTKRKYEPISLTLDYAAKCDVKEIVELILTDLKHGISDFDLQMALIAAVDCGSDRVFDLLVKSKININAIDHEKKLALHFAAAKGRKEMAQILINSGAVINIEDSRGYTPLEYAIKNEYKEVVELLLHFGVRVSHDDIDLAKNFAKKWRSDVKRRSNMDEIIKLLESEPKRRLEEILKLQEFISKKIEQASDFQLINDLAKIITQYAYSLTYKDVLEFNKNYNL